jgi:two-component system, cell cycle sensor histidine kinase and response regulator CckA
MANILVVEDEKIVAADIASTLEGLGYSVPGVVSSGEEAIRRVNELHPDLVLMDIMLDGQMDGVQAARLMRQRFRIPVVFLTAYADGDSLNRARVSEPFGYIVKPFNEKELRSTIEIALYKHEVEQQLMQRERWFSTTLKCVGDAVIATDPDGKLTFMNPLAEALIGWKAEQAVGRAITDIFRVIDQETGDGAEHPVKAILQGRTSSSPAHTALINREGREIAIDGRTAPIIDTKDILLGAVMVFRDITERKRNESRMMLADRLASVGAMAAGVAHEINNPLTYLIGNLGFGIDELRSVRTEIAGDGAAPSNHQQAALIAKLDSALEALTESREGAQRVQRVMQDLGTFSRAGDEVSTRVNLQEILEAALKLTASQTRARVSKEFQPVPPVNANPSKLGQVFVNLLVNASKAVQKADAPGEIRVSTYTDARCRAVVEISDTGPGMARDVLGRIFQPYSPGEAEAGRGMGLAICQEIVTQSGGEIAVESQLGRGTVFRVTLPASSLENSAAKPFPKLATPLRKGRILVVDDEPIVGGSIRRTLVREHEVVVVTSGKEAMTLLEQGELFDLILSDVMMPEMSGIELYRQLLRIRPKCAERMIFLTGGAFTQGARKFLDSVPNPRLEKPFDPDRLREFIRERL